MKGRVTSSTSRARACLLILFVAYKFYGFSQNLDEIGKSKPIKVSGGINVNNVLYHAVGIEQRRDPYNYFFSGNLNFDIYGWSIPFSYTFSNQQSSFQQPFNQYSLHPTYKFITGHFGYTSTTFSPYTLSGHIFLGAAVDATPEGRFSYSVMYGRLQKAVQADTLNESTQPAFKRMGYGVKVSYKDDGDYADLIIFGAKDDLNSLVYIPDIEELLPQENLVLSIGGGKRLFQRFLINAEIATSGITRDIRAPRLIQEDKNLFTYTKGIFTPRTSSQYYKAFKSGLTYNANIFTLGVGYERVDPGYQTLGAYYFNNDLENITANASTSLMQGKVNLSGNIGVQRDNLDNVKISTMERVVGSFNAGYTIGESLNLTGTYSNFKTYTNIRSQFENINQLTPFDNLDTLNYTQLSQNAGLNVNYRFPASETKRQSFNMNVTVQDVADQQGGVEVPSGSRFYNVNTAYSLSLVPQNMGISAAFNYNNNTGAELNTTTLGPSFGVRRSFMDKKARTSLSASYNNSYTNGALQSSVRNVRMNGSYVYKENHHLNLNLVVINRSNKSESGLAEFTEFTATVGYNYNF